MRQLLPSSPHFFGPVGRALAVACVVLAPLAAAIPAPLDPPASPQAPPNPVKSAWFLVWIQELVSHDTRLVYGAVGLAGLLVGLPWLVRHRTERAGWLQPEYHRVTAVVVGAVLVVLTLTVVAVFFRGANWCLTLP